MDVPIGPMVSEILNKLKETRKNECNFNMNTNTVEMLLVRANEMNKNNVMNKYINYVLIINVSLLILF